MKRPAKLQAYKKIKKALDKGYDVTHMLTKFEELYGEKWEGDRP